MAEDRNQPGDEADPWAGIDAEAAAEAGADFSFSFEDDEPSAPAPEPSPGDDVPLPTMDVLAEEDPGVGAAPKADADGAGSTFADAFADAGEEEDVASWLDEPGDVEAAPALSVFHEEDAWSAEGDPEAAVGQSSVEIGTGTSGLPSPSHLDSFDGEISAVESAAASGENDEADPFADLSVGTEPTELGSGDLEHATQEADGDADPWATLQGEPADSGHQPGEPEVPDFGIPGVVAGAASAALGGIAAESEETRPSAGAKPKRAPPPAKRRKPSVVRQLVGVVLGGVMAIPVTLGILVWGFGRDPFKLTPLVPESMAFLMPEKFRPAGAGTDLGAAPSLDDLAGQFPTPEPQPPSPEDSPPAAEPGTDAVAVAEPAAGETAGEPVMPADAAAGDDPLMALLNEADEPASPPPPPEPEPLDLSGLAQTSGAAVAAVEALAAVDDPEDPARKKLEVSCYRALAAHALELAMLERVAADTGRPLEMLPEPAVAVERAVADRPQLFDTLGRLTRFWLVAKKRSTEGVMMPVLLRSSERVGPYWRTVVTLADDAGGGRDLVVLSRSEPGVAPGDPAIVTGLVVGEATVWGSAISPAKSGDPFGS